MEITEAKEGETTIVSLDGHLDTVSSQPLEDRLVAMIDGGVRQLLLNCTDLSYLNSSGLKAILVTAKRLEPLRGKLVIYGLVSNVHMIFEMIGFTRILNIVATREEAMRMVTGAAAANAPGTEAPA